MNVLRDIFIASCTLGVHTYLNMQVLPIEEELTSRPKGPPREEELAVLKRLSSLKKRANWFKFLSFGCSSLLAYHEPIRQAIGSQQYIKIIAATSTTLLISGAIFAALKYGHGNDESKQKDVGGNAILRKSLPSIEAGVMSVAFIALNSLICHAVPYTISSTIVSKFMKEGAFVLAGTIAGAIYASIIMNKEIRQQHEAKRIVLRNNLRDAIDAFFKDNETTPNQKYDGVQHMAQGLESWIEYQLGIIEKGKTENDPLYERVEECNELYKGNARKEKEEIKKSLSSYIPIGSYIGFGLSNFMLYRKPMEMALSAGQYLKIAGVAANTFIIALFAIKTYASIPSLRTEIFKDALGKDSSIYESLLSPTHLASITAAVVLNTAANYAVAAL